MAFQGPTQQFNYQGFPKLDSPLIDENGYVSAPWYRFFASLWTKLGGSYTQLPLVQVLQSNAGGTMVVNATTGENVGEVVLSGTAVSVGIVLASAPPTDQGRPQTAPMLPGDSFGNANAVNNALMLEPH